MIDSRRYEQTLARHSHSLREPDATPLRPPGELELQAQFYRGGLGWHLRSETGEEIEILHPGRWNHEPGPDFTGARIRLGEKEVRGDIEIDPDAADWERHHHSSNPAFDGVVLHLFATQPSRKFFTKTSQNREVTQAVLPISLEKTPIPPTRRGGSPLEVSEAVQLIESAFEYRLHRKRRALLASIDRLGIEESLFHSLAEGMGYKNNKIPFLLVAERVGWERARKADGEALLFGIAGFLAARDFDDADEEDARACMRALWERWWEVRDASSRLILPREAWKFAAVRPANHPHRRMAALSKVAPLIPRLADSAKNADAGAFIRLLTGVSHEFWNRHASVACQRLSRPVAMVGQDRALELAINILVPAADPDRAFAMLREMPAPAPSTKVVEAAQWLCGESGGALAKSAWMQQGLLQLHTDFFGEDPRSVYSSILESMAERMI